MNGSRTAVLNPQPGTGGVSRTHAGSACERHQESCPPCTLIVPGRDELADVDRTVTTRIGGGPPLLTSDNTGYERAPSRTRASSNARLLSRIGRVSHLAGSAHQVLAADLQAIGV